MKSKTKSIYQKIKSKYILLEIFGYLSTKKKLEIIKYNKEMQKNFEIKLKDYKEYKNILIQNMLLFPEFKTDPKEIKNSSVLVNNADTKNTFSQNVFLLFKSYNDEKYYLIYYNFNNSSIISYDIFKNIKMKEVNVNTKENIPICFSHYPDISNKSDLIMTIDASANSIKVYNFPDFNFIHYFTKINKSGYLNTANFLYDENKIYVMTSNHRYTGKNVEPIKIYDLKGNKIKELKESNENCSFIDSYYDKKISKRYILAGFSKYIRTYDFSSNKIYKVYKDKYKSFHRNIIVNDYEEEIKLIESGTDGYIRIWNFHKGDLIKRINIDKEGVFGICLWNKEELFVGIHTDIKLINLNTEEIISNLNLKYSNFIYDHQKDVIAIKKINLPKYGESLLIKFQGVSNIRIITK